MLLYFLFFFFFKQKTAYEMRISDWSSDVCSSDLTSAGRVPTDKGYRLFVDRLTKVKPMSAAEQRAISNFLQGAVDLDDVVQRSVRQIGRASCRERVCQYV